MNNWKSGKKKSKEKNDNRINLVIAIVFLLGLATICKMYNLQVVKYDYYTAMASGQQQIFNELKPERGRIFITDRENDSDMYPFATNKDFAFVYAVPKDIENSEDTAEKLYIIFKQEEQIKEIDELFEEEEEAKKQEELDFVDSLELGEEELVAKKTEIIQRYESLKNNSEHQELLKLKKEEELAKRKEESIKEYREVLEKENDPYEPIEKKVDEETLKELYALLSDNKEINASDLFIKEGKVLFKNEEGEDENVVFSIAGIAHTMISHRFYPEENIGSHILGFVRNIDDKSEGVYGLEGFFNEELIGQYGTIKTERGADNIIIVNDREYIKPKNGLDLRLTIDRSIQFTVCQELNKAAEEYAIDSGSVVIIKPNTGEIIAMCSWPDFDPNNYDEVKDIKVYNNPTIFFQYEPGSVFKTITMAAAIDQGKVSPDTTYNDEGQIMVEGWHKPIKNSDFSTNGAHGIVDMNTVLADSLNTGSIFAMEQIGKDIFADYVVNFGFGERTGIEMETEVGGNISNLLADYIKPVDAAVASFGQGITTTPLQMVMSYAAIANGGILMKPYIVKEIIYEDGTSSVTQSRQIKKVVSEKTATLVKGMLVNVVESGHASLAAVDGYYVGGKTGTAQVASSEVAGYGSETIHTFIGMAPIDEPKFVMLVKLDNPKNAQYSASTSAPLFGKIAKFLLQYYQVPQERD